MPRNRYDTRLGVMLVMMMTAADPNKTPSVLSEQSDDLADFHARTVRRYVGLSTVVSLQVVPVLRFAMEQKTRPMVHEESNA
jgi:hypothetical protein